MSDFRLGDVLDDYCVKCRRLTNHSIVSLVGAKAAKVRCRTCYSDHDYRNEQIPPSKKDLKKAALFNQVLAAAVGPAPPTGAPGAGLPMLDPLATEILSAEPLATEAPAAAADPSMAKTAPDASPTRPKGKQKQT
jgi:hypothetical protein